jgi:hypothetical protein
MTTQLSMLSAIREGHEQRLREVLAEIPLRDASPFASVPGTHNGRWVVVNTAASPSATLRAGGLDAPLLMCSAVIDREPREWVDDLLRVLGPLADEIWSHCPGWPTAATDRADHLLSGATASSLDFATWDQPVERIRTALALRRRLASFAVRTQRFEPDALLEAYRKEFAP